MIKTIVTTRLRTLAAAVRHLTGAAPASLLLLLLLTLLTACQQDNLVTDAQGNALNPDGTVTITRLNVSIGTEAATRASLPSRPAADKGYTAGVKTGFVSGDVLHLVVFLTEGDLMSNTPQFSNATFDGSKWTLNPAIRLPQNPADAFGIQIFYDGTTTAYNSYLLEGDSESGEQFYAPGNFVRAYYEAVCHVNDGTPWVNTKHPETATPLKDANGNAYFHDALHCAGGTSVTANSKIGSLTIGAGGTLGVTMEHANALVRITSVNNQLGSSVARAELITRGYSDKIPTTFTLWGEGETAGTPGNPGTPGTPGTDPTVTAPWQAVIGTAGFGDSNANPPYVLGSIRITLANGNSFTVSLPLPPDADPIDPTDPTSGFCAKPNHVYAYRLTLEPGSLTAVPVSTSGDLSWTTSDPVPFDYKAIYNREDLEAIRNNMAGKYILMKNINLSGTEWTPLGYDATGGFIAPFSGHFNGNGYSILGLTSSNSDKRNFGLFARLKDALIYNLHFSEAKITSIVATSSSTRTGIGTLAGYAESSTVSLCSATDCNVTYSGPEASGSYPISIGALIGNSTGSSSNKNTLTQCHATRCTVDGKMANYAGGLVGQTMDYNSIVACYTRACTVSLTSTTNVVYFAGGLIGKSGNNDNKNLIYGCYATNANPSNGTAAHGALVGNNFSYKTGATNINLIASCYATLAANADTRLVGFNGNPGIDNDYGNTLGTAKILACVSPQSDRTKEEPTVDKEYVVSLSARATSRGYLPLTDTAEIIALTEGTAPAPGTTPEEQAANATGIAATFANFGFTASGNTLSLTVNAVKVDATTGELTTGQLTFDSTAPIWPGLTEATKMIPPMIKW